MHVTPSVSRHGNATPLHRMFVLSMTASRPNVPPSVVLDELHEISYFHPWSDVSHKDDYYLNVTLTGLAVWPSAVSEIFV
jgi:hypothetical protein